VFVEASIQYYSLYHTLIFIITYNMISIKISHISVRYIYMIACSVAHKLDYSAVNEKRDIRF